MKIGQKIAAGFGLTLALLLAIGLVSYLSLQRMVQASDAVTHSGQIIDELDDLLSALREVETSQRGYLLTAKESYLEPYRQSLADIEQGRQNVRRLTAGDVEQQRSLEALQAPIALKLSVLQESIDARRNKGFEAALAIIDTAASLRAMDDPNAKVAAMHDVETTRFPTREAEAKRTAAVAFGVILYGSAIAIVVVIAAGWWILRSITGPVGELVAAAEAVGRGELDRPIAIRSKDEIGTLAAAIAGMTESLRGEKQRVEKLLEAIAASANQLASTTAQILAGTSQQASGAEQQAAAVAETVTTVDEVLQTSEQASQRARAVADASQRSVDVGKAGRRAIDESMAAMATVKEQTEASAESILALAEQAQAIADIIATVNDIAEQTNLLALNAAIEASRAGEHGLGFGVVAAEVKALASQSKKATAQVRQILGEIQKATNGAVLATEEGTKSVQATAKVIAQAGETIRSLAETIAEASQAAAQIAASANQQSAGMAQIHQAMRNIKQVTTQNLASTKQADQAARDLNLLGTKLKGLLGAHER
jgi:methyl-accepting chemotaxis protein